MEQERCVLSKGSQGAPGTSAFWGAQGTTIGVDTWSQAPGFPQKRARGAAMRDSGGTRLALQRHPAAWRGVGVLMGHLVDEAQVPLDGGLVVLPLLPQLPA